MRLKRRTVLSGLVGLSLPLIASSCTSDSTQSSNSSSPTTTSAPAATEGATIRIGYQKATDLDLLRTRGELDRQLQSLGARAEWSLFPSGPPMLEAMNAGSIDFGGVGEAPPIFSQAAGGQFYYISVITLAPETQDIVVPNASSVQAITDLKGKRIALQRGSSAHYLLLKTFQEEGIALDAAEIASLSPADARSAFEQGNVDAWSIWDPFLGVIQSTGTARDLKVGRDRYTYFLASQQFTEAHPDVLKAALEAAKANGDWATQNIKSIAQQFAQEVKVDATVLETVYGRRSWTVQPITADTQTVQQEVADLFLNAQVIPQAVEVKSAFLPAEAYTKIFPS